MKRGEIYYIQRRDTIGSEITKSRPGIVVSNNALNSTSDVVEVVYLTTQPKRDMPTHVIINATGCTSTALCEHIDHVSVELIGDYCGSCSDSEMEAVDRALQASLGIPKPEPGPEQRLKDLHVEYERACAERDAYKALLEKVLG